MSNPYSVFGMMGKWFMLTVRLGVRFLARLGPIAEAWDRVLTPPEHLNRHQIRRANLKEINGTMNPKQYKQTGDIPPWSKPAIVPIKIMKIIVNNPELEPYTPSTGSRQRTLLVADTTSEEILWDNSEEGKRDYECTRDDCPCHTGVGISDDNIYFYIDNLFTLPIEKIMEELNWDTNYSFEYISHSVEKTFTYHHLVST